MAIQKTEAIILHSLNYKESSKIITCFTLDYGRVSLLAKGARRAKSRIGGALDLLQHVMVVYYSKPTRSLQTLSQADVIYSFQKLSQDLSRLSYGLATAELLNRLEIADQPNPWLFRQFVATLHAYESCREPEICFYQFFWKWLENAGVRARLRRCLRCGAQVSDERIYFSVAQGGFFCSKCYRNQEKTVEISGKSFKLLLFLRENSVKACGNLRVAESLLQEVRKLSWLFLQFHFEVGNSLKSLAFLRQIEKKSADLI